MINPRKNKVILNLWLTKKQEKELIESLKLINDCIFNDDNLQISDLEKSLKNAKNKIVEILFYANKQGDLEKR